MKFTGLSSLAIILALVGIVSAQNPPQIGLEYGNEGWNFVPYGTCIHVTPGLKRVSYSVRSTCQYYRSNLCQTKTDDVSIIHEGQTSSPATKREGFVKCTPMA